MLPMLISRGRGVLAGGEEGEEEEEEDERVRGVVDHSVVSFCSRSVAFLRHWPLQHLVGHPNHCMFHYFNRGQVLVRDSNNSDWIYIVKSGSLSVLKKLHHATATPTSTKVTQHPTKVAQQGQGENSDVRNGSDEPSREGGGQSLGSRHAPRRHRKGRKNPTSPEVFRNPMEADRRLEQSLPGVFNTTERLGTVDYDRIITQYRARVLPKPGFEPQTPRLLPPIQAGTGNERVTGGPDHVTGRSEDGLGGSTSLPAEVDDRKEARDVVGGGEAEEDVGESRPVSKTSKGVYLAASSTRRRRKNRERDPEVSLTPQQLSDRRHVTGVTSRGDGHHVTTEGAEEQTEASVTARLQKLNIDYQRRFREHMGRKTMADQLDHKGSRDFRYTEVDLHPMFVLVRVLERGQYFGVSQLLYPDQPSLCVVSNGAELVVVSKKLFMEKADEACLNHVRQTECPYPPEETLQCRLQDYVDWEAHRGRVYRRLVTDLRKRQARRKQFLPRVPGHYCFRSGPL